MNAKPNAKIKVPTVAPNIWLTGRPPNFDAMVGNSPQPSNGPRPIKIAIISVRHLYIYLCSDYF